MTQRRTHRMYETNIHNTYCICIYYKHCNLYRKYWKAFSFLFFFLCRFDLLIFSICTVHTFIHLYMEISRTGARKIYLSYKNPFYFPAHRLIVLLLLNINSLTTATNPIAFAQPHLVIVVTKLPWHLSFNLSSFITFFDAFQPFCWISSVIFCLLSFSFSLLFSLGFY